MTLLDSPSKTELLRLIGLLMQKNKLFKVYSVLTLCSPPAREIDVVSPLRLSEFLRSSTVEELEGLELHQIREILGITPVLPLNPKP